MKDTYNTETFPSEQYANWNCYLHMYNIVELLLATTSDGGNDTTGKGLKRNRDHMEKTP